MSPTDICWPEKKVLVTGGKGFQDHVLCRVYRKKGKKVIAPSKKEYDLTNLEDCREFCNMLILCFMLLEKLGGIGLNREKPAELFYENLMMGIQLINESKNANIEKVYRHWYNM